MTRYSIEPRTRKYVKGYGFLLFSRKYKKRLVHTGLDASKKVVHKAGEFLGNKTADAVTMTVLRYKSLLKKSLFQQKKEMKY